MTQLQFNFREHDLPPKWDGKKIAWNDNWEQLPRAFICPPPPPSTCEGCGSQATPSVKFGKVGPQKEWRRTGHGQTRKTRQWERITAFRCPDCRADYVLGPDGQMWNLGPEDYGAEGSNSVEVETLGEKTVPRAPEPQRKYPPLKLVKGRGDGG